MLSEAVHLSNIVWSWGKCPRRRAGRYLRLYSWVRRKPCETRALYIRLAPVIIPLQNLRWQCGGGAPLSVCSGDECVSSHQMECRLVFGRLPSDPTSRGISKSITGLFCKPINKPRLGERLNRQCSRGLDQLNPLILEQRSSLIRVLYRKIKNVSIFSDWTSLLINHRRSPRFHWSLREFKGGKSEVDVIKVSNASWRLVNENQRLARVTAERPMRQYRA